MNKNALKSYFLDVYVFMHINRCKFHSLVQTLCIHPDP